MDYSSVCCSDSRADRRTDNELRWMPSEPCDWSPEISQSLLHFFLECNYPYRKIVEIPFEDPLRSEVRRLFISLDAYMESEDRAMSDKDILYRSVEQNYAAYLKKIKRKSFIKSWGGKQFSEPEWWNDVPWYQISDIGQIFNYSYTIHWKTEDEEDYIHGMIPVEEADMTEFKDALKRILPDEPISQIADFDILCKISSSRSFDAKTRKKGSHFEMKPKRLYFNSKRTLACRSIIDVGPANKRDSILVDPADLNTINLIDAQLSEILKKMQNHIHLKDSNEIDRRLIKLANKYTIFLQRDIKKEGITKPFHISKAVLEVIDEVYPYLNLGRFINFYNDYQILVKDEVLNMKRGHGLGMANSLTTIMNLVVHEMVTSNVIKSYINIDCSCLALNDDFVVGFESEEDAEEYWAAEDRVMSNVGLLRAVDKSFLTHSRFTIAERYFYEKWEHKKESYVLRELYLPLACSTIAQAKESFAATQVNVSHEKVDKVLSELISYWGYEFFEKEGLYPFLCGGWFNPHFAGVDLTFPYMEDLPFNHNVAAAIEAVCERPRKEGKGSVYDPPIFLISGHPEIPTRYHERLLKIPIDQIKEKFYRSRQVESYKRYHSKWIRKRKAKFKEKSRLSYSDAIKFIIKNNETKTFYPNSDMINGYALSDMYVGSISDPYIDPNPYLALVAKYNNISYKFKEEYSFICKGADSFKLKDILISPDMRWSYWNNLMAYKFDEIDAAINIPRNYSPENYYLEPVKIGVVSSTLYLNSGYPILRPEFVSPLIEKKREVFGRFLSIEELLIIKEFEIEREMIKNIVELGYTINRENVERFIDLINTLTEKEDLQISKNLPPNPLINISRLMDDKDIIINWYEDKKDYQIEDEETRKVLAKFSGFISIMEVYAHSADFPNALKREKAKFSGISRAILENSSLEEFFNKRHLEAFIEKEESDQEETAFGNYYSSDSCEDFSDGEDSY